MVLLLLLKQILTDERATGVRVYFTYRGFMSTLSLASLLNGYRHCSIDPTYLICRKVILARAAAYFPSTTLHSEFAVMVLCSTILTRSLDSCRNRELIVPGFVFLGSGRLF